MKLEKLKTLVKRGESEVLEFKKSTAQLSAAMQTICAFLNSEQGGTIFIGVSDDKKILGQEVSDSTQKEIAGEMSRIEPHADIDVSYVSVGLGKQVIVIQVDPGLRAPYVYDGRPFMRSQATTRRMPQEKYEHLLGSRRTTTIAWESLTTNDCTLNDLDKKLIRDVVRMGITAGRVTDIAALASIGEILKSLS